MSVNYTRLKALATRLIGENGKTATLRQSDADQGDAWNPTEGSDTDTAVTVVDLGLDQSFVGLAARGLDAQGAVSRANQKVLMRTSEGVTPVEGDQLQIGGDWRNIVSVNTVAPGPVTIMFEVDLAT